MIRQFISIPLPIVSVLVLMVLPLFLVLTEVSNGLSIIEQEELFDEDFYYETAHYHRPAAPPYRGERIGRVRREILKNIRIQQQLIPANYNILEPPPTLNGLPNRVNLSVIIMNIRGIDEKEEEMTLEMNLRMYWRDPRLGQVNATGNNSFIVLSPKLIHDIWHPDIFIDHAISVSQPSVVTAPASLRIYPSDDYLIRYSARLTVTTACEMNFHFYPVDSQECAVQMMSYAYVSKVMELAWASNGVFFANKNLKLANFKVDLDHTQRQTTNTSSGHYSNLQFTIILQRNISYHLIQTYLPSFIFLVISWFCFLIPEKNKAERISCCMVTLLSLTVMFGSLGQVTPQVSYFTGLHIWMITCVISVFVSFIEFIIVLKLHSMSTAILEAERRSKLSQKRRRKKNNSKYAVNHAFELHETTLTNEMQRPHSGGGGAGDFASGGESSRNSSINGSTSNLKIDKYAYIANSVEKVTSIALPCLFLTFNLVYWPWLCAAT